MPSNTFDRASQGHNDLIKMPECHIYATYLISLVVSQLGNLAFSMDK